jgi:hypothetical protein
MAESSTEGEQGGTVFRSKRFVLLPLHFIFSSQKLLVKKVCLVGNCFCLIVRFSTFHCRANDCKRRSTVYSRDNILVASQLVMFALLYFITPLLFSSFFYKPVNFYISKGMISLLGLNEYSLCAFCITKSRLQVKTWHAMINLTTYKICFIWFNVVFLKANFLKKSRQMYL